MFDIVFVIHILLCVVLIGMVLVQQGKGADAGAIMGGGTDSVFAAGSAGSVISKLTTGLAIAFMITSITLVKLYQERSFVSRNNSNVLEGSVLEGALNKKAVDDASEKTDTDLPGLETTTTMDNAEKVAAKKVDSEVSKVEEKIAVTVDKKTSDK